MAHPYRRHIVEHRGLVAGLCDARGLGAVSDPVTQPHPARRIVTASHAVNALVRNGLGLVHPPLDLGPRCCQDQPPLRRLTPAWSDATHLPDAARGRAWETLDDDGVTARSRLMAATAAARRGLAARLTPRDRTSVHGEGRSQNATRPAAPVGPSTRGARREQRPALHHVMRERMVEPHAGLPGRMTPRRGHRREAQGVGQVVRAPIDPVHTTDGPTDVGADRARYRAEHRPQRAPTPLTWLTRVPATVSAAPAVLAQAAPQARMPLTEGERAHVVPSISGGIAPRGVRIDAASRPPPATRTGATPLLKHRAPAVHAFKQRCATAWACDVEARQAFAPVAPGWQATGRHAITLGPRPRHGPRGRPGHSAPPDPMPDQISGGLASP